MNFTNLIKNYENMNLVLANEVSEINSAIVVHDVGCVVMDNEDLN